MEEQKEKTNYDRFKNMSFGELWDVAMSRATPKTLKEEIRMFLCENYVKSPDLAYDESLKDLSEKQVRAEIGLLVINARNCARDIIKGLDIEHINSLQDVTNVTDSHIRSAKDYLNFP